MSGHIQHPGQPPHDLRVYTREPGYEPQINREDTRLFCHAQQEGEEYFHRIAVGEVYLAFGFENYCLNCCYRRGIITTERPTLEHAVSSAP